jgi:hypothetical protein
MNFIKLLRQNFNQSVPASELKTLRLGPARKNWKRAVRRLEEPVHKGKSALPVLTRREKLGLLVFGADAANSQGNGEALAM